MNYKMNKKHINSKRKHQKVIDKNRQFDIIDT